MEYFSNKHFFSYSQCRSRILVDRGMFLRTPSVGAASVSGCTWSWSWEHDKSLNKGQQDLTKLNTTASSICGWFDTCKMLYSALVGITHQMRSMWYYGFISFLSKQILQVLWLETVGFLSQNYIIPHNNLVDMIVLLEYFPTSINTCIWNKLCASFYLRMLWTCHFGISNKVWFMNLQGGGATFILYF
jgi:hypothetical protein